MNDRRGVVMVMFDLPVKNSDERRLYTDFRKKLIRHGYGYFQNSVYLKLLRNISSAERELHWLDTTSPSRGNVQAIAMNLNVFRGLTPVRGIGFNTSVFADDVVFMGDDSVDYPPEIEDSQLLRMCEQLKHSRENSSEECDDDDVREETETSDNEEVMLF